MLGRTVDEVIGQRDVDLFSPKEAATMAAENAQVLATGETLMQEITIEFESGPRVFQTNKTPYRDEQGKVAGVIGVCRDITEVKLADEMVRRNERLSSIGTLTAGVAHSLNNALSPVVGLADVLLQDPTLPSHLRRHVDTIMRGAADAVDTVRRLQRFSSLKTEAAPPEQVDASEILRQVLEAARPAWTEADVRIDADCEEPVPVWVNPSELRQALTHLVQNAIDSMPRGGRLTASTRVGSNKVGHITVSDTGTGMTDEQQARCHIPFYTTKPDGNGLGLSVCYGIAKRYEGELQIASELHRGTMVNLVLPAEGMAETEKTGAALAQRAPEQVLRLLVVDDDPLPRRTLATLAEACGQEATTVASGDEALAVCQREQFDAVLTDVGMSSMDGWELAERLREAHPGLPIVFVTGWAADDVEERMGRGRVKPDAVIEKPVTLDKLAAALANLPARTTLNDST